MKYILILFIPFFYSCFKSVESTNTNFYIGEYCQPIKIVKIDSCEYLFGDWGNATILTHKGNCQYCKKIIQK